ncbi:MAG: hypothetical protein ABSA70_08330 [Terriglobia bacterium]
MDKDGQLRLKLLNVYGELLGGSVDIILHNQNLTDNQIARAPASKRILIKDLYGAPQGLYRIEVDPPSYLPISQFVNLKASGITNVEITFPIEPKKVKSVTFPAYQGLAGDLTTLLENSNEVLGFEGKGGDALYDALDDIRKAGLLNIFKKAANTRLSNGQTVFPYIQSLIELRGDRFFAAVPKVLREETKNSVAAGVFSPASELLHRPPEGFTKAESFKTGDRYGNLQLSFFARGDEWVVDVDIDDAAGLEHWFQVLRNTLTGRPTHPYDIHEILVSYQHLDPDYRFVV